MEKICVRMPNWVGDVVMATPALYALKSSFPEAQITAVIADSVRPVIRCCRAIDSVIPYKRDLKPFDATLEFLRCTAKIRNSRCDAAVVLPNSFSSALMMRLAAVRKRIGYRRDARSVLLTDALQRPSGPDGGFAPVYMAEYYMNLCTLLGAKTGDTHPRLDYRDSDMLFADSVLNEQGIDPERPLFLMHAQAGFGPSKLWPEEKFAALADMLHGFFEAQIAFIGSPAALPPIERIRNRASVPTFNLAGCGIDLHLLKCVVKRSRLLVSTDSGPRHYGVALDVPTVCIMGPTAPQYTDSGLPHDAVVRAETACGPCQKKTCASDHRCMHLITPERVFDRCKEQLSAEGCF